MSTSRTREKADGELFKSTGIDDNATSTAVTIDASENVLVGKTSQDSSLSGCELLNNGTAQFTRDGNSGLRINRLTSDGELLRLSKAGTTVGSIRSDSGSIMLGSGDVGVYFDAPSDRILPTNITAGSVRNDAIDIGGNPHRFKDLYLSGGVYLGGTGAANKLDDFEEGTWTPSFGGSTSNPTVNFNVAGGTYVKVGRLVTIGVKTTTVSVSGGSGGLFLNGLPFARSTDANYGAVAGLTQNFNALPSEPLRGYLSTDYIRFKYGNAVDVPTSVLRTSGDSNQIWMSFTYETES